MNHPFLPLDEMLRVNRAVDVCAKVTVPGSKSLTNRLLLLAALAEGRTLLKGALASDDTRYMRAALDLLGVKVETRQEDWVVFGQPTWCDPTETLFIGNAGTAMRFLTPAIAVQRLNATITGNARMVVRPIGDLVDGLRQLGGYVEFQGKEGYPPLHIKGPLSPGVARVKGTSSSQYLSGLLMALPLLKGDSRIEIDGSLVSRTYVAMTLSCMDQFGVKVESDEAFRTFSIRGGQVYQAQNLTVEPDASTASYWFALPLMIGGRVEVCAIPKCSSQGDLGILTLFEQMGASIEQTSSGVAVARPESLRGIEADMNTMSDVAPTLAVVATMAHSPTTIRNVANMRIKECDRIATIQRAFDQLGLKMESGPDWMKIYPGSPVREALLDPEDDHRMAMVFSLLGLAHGGVSLKNPECVAKTYPDFFTEFAAALN